MFDLLISFVIYVNLIRLNLSLSYNLGDLNRIFLSPLFYTFVYKISLSLLIVFLLQNPTHNKIIITINRNCSAINTF